MKIPSHNILVLVPILILISGCENFLSSPKPPVDYTGQIDSVVDVEGNTYKTIGIGSQIWMAQNLKSTKFNDGSKILQVISDSIWSKLKSPAYCWYGNDSVSFKNTYGLLYNFYSVNSGLLCPTGWHIPTDSEWKILESFLGGSEIAGGKLKDYYGNFWSDPNICYVNNYEFSALPGGRRRHYTGKFYDIRDAGYWWINTSQSTLVALLRSMTHENTQLSTFEGNKSDGYSVRCLKDQ